MWLGRIGGFLAALVLATGVASAQAPVGATAAYRGRLSVPEASWDFGHVVKDAQVIHRFILENVGADTLFISKIEST